MYTVTFCDGFMSTAVCFLNSCLMMNILKFLQSSLLHKSMFLGDIAELLFSHISLLDRFIFGCVCLCVFGALCRRMTGL